MSAHVSRIAARRQARVAPRHLTDRRGVRPPSVWNRLVRVFLFSVSLLILAGVVVLWFAWHKSDSVHTERNILFVSADLSASDTPLVLVHLVPQTQKIEMIRLAPEMSVSVLGGYGKYPLRSILPLFLLDHRSSDYIRAAYSSALGIPIHTVVTTATHSATLHSPQAGVLFWQLLRNHFQSNLAFFDRFRLWRAARRATQPASDDIKMLDSVDALEKHLHDWRLQAVSPECSVAILNTTAVKGVGAAVTKILEKNGVPVVRLSDSTEETQVTRVEVAQTAPFCDDVVDQFAGVFPFSVPIRRNTNVRAQHRANIVIFIGEDFAQEWAQ